MKKKLLAGLLALCMVMTMLPLAAFADDSTSTDNAGPAVAGYGFVWNGNKAEKPQQDPTDLAAGATTSGDWIGQTLYVVLKEALPQGHSLWFKVTVTKAAGGDASKTAETQDWGIISNGNGSHKTFACSFLNTSQWETKPNDVTDGVAVGDTIKVEVYYSATKLTQAVTDVSSLGKPIFTTKEITLESKTNVKFEAAEPSVALANPNLTAYPDYDASNPNTNAPWANVDLKFANTAEEGKVNVTLKVTNLVKHGSNTDNTQPAAYWVGIAVPKAENDTSTVSESMSNDGNKLYKQGWNSVGSDLIKPDGYQTVNGKVYATFYFGLDDDAVKGTKKGVVVAGDTTYTIDFTGSTLKDETQTGEFKFVAVPGSETIFTKAVNAYQTSLTITAVADADKVANGADHQYKATGTLVKVTDNWTDFNKDLVAEQTGYYMAFCVPNAKDGKTITKMVIPGHKADGTAEEKVFEGQTLTNAFSDKTAGSNSQSAADCCYLVVHLNDAANASKVYTMKLTYAEGAEETYSIDYSALIPGTVKQDLTVADLEYTAPTNLVYNGENKTATVTVKSDKASGAGAVTVTYYTVDGEGTETKTTETKNVGKYIVKAAVAEGDSYNALAETKVGEFTITAAPTAATTFGVVPQSATPITGHAVSDLQEAGVTIAAKSGSTTEFVLSGGKSKQITDWTQFNETIEDEQNGYYMAIYVPKTMGGEEIQEMRIPGHVKEGDQIKAVTKAYVKDPTNAAPETNVNFYAIDPAFTDKSSANGVDNDCCYLVVHLPNTQEKVYTIQLKYGASGTLTNYKFDYTALVPEDLPEHSFDYNEPENLVYNGEDKNATVTYLNGITVEQAGRIIITYYAKAADGTETKVTETKNAGTYVVKVATEGGTKYNAFAETKMDEFTVTKAPVTGVTVTETNVTDGVEGKIEAGDTLTATAAPAGATVTYQWKNNGTDIADATSATYEVKATDTSLTVAVTGTGNYDGAAESAALVVGKTVLTGTLTVALHTEDGKLHLTKNDVPAEATYDIVWLRDGTAITGETGDTYEITKADRGHAISAKLVATGDYTGEVAVAAGNEYQVLFEKPASVTRVTATAGSAQVTVRWTAPADNGGADITKYTVVCKTKGANEGDAPIVVETKEVTDGTSCVFTGLTNGTEYSFAVTATNAAEMTSDVADGSVAKATPTAGSTGGNTGTGGGFIPSIPTNPTTPSNPSTSDGNTSVDVPANVSNGSASTTVSDSTASAIVNEAVKSESDNVTVNVSTNANVNSASAEIPASAVASLASDTNASLTVATPVADVVIPNEALAELGAESGTVAVSAAKADDGTITVDVKKNGESVATLPAAIKVTAPVSEEAAEAGTGLVAVIVDADGNETVVPKSVLDDKEMSVMLETGSATVKFVDNSKSFDDVEQHWADEQGAIDFVSSRGLFTGTTATSFEPDTNTTRAMMVTVLHRLESTPSASGVNFNDVPSDAYYAEAASWATDLGITTGTGAGFEGSKTITREQMVTMLYRYAKKLAPSAGKMGSVDGMTGADQVSDWAVEAMSWAVGSGLIEGDANGLRPDGTSTRAEMATVLMRFVKLITE